MSRKNGWRNVKLKKKDPKWLGDWDSENDHREETSTLKNGHKIKEWRSIQWEISRRIKKKEVFCEGMNTSFQILIKTSCKVLKFFPPAGSTWLESPGGEKSQQLWSQRETADREEQEKSPNCREAAKDTLHPWRSSNKNESPKPYIQLHHFYLS